MIRPTVFLVVVAVTAAMSGTALAQTPTAPTVAGETKSSWLVSGFVGANFGTTRDSEVELDLLDPDSDASLDFGGQFGYLWRGTFGAEALFDFAPSVGMAGVVFSGKPNLNSYMGNVVGAIPLGAEGKYQPYVSGGFGAIRLKGDAFNIIGDPLGGTVSASHTKFGGNIGGGIMAFAGHLGIRGDVRFYQAGRDDTLAEDGVPDEDLLTAPVETIRQAVFSGLGFWRGNVGLAIRW